MAIQLPVKALVQRNAVTIVDATGKVVEVVRGHEDNYAVAKARVAEINAGQG